MPQPDARADIYQRHHRELAMQVAKAAMAEAADNTRALMNVKDAQELVALQAALLQPSAERLLAGPSLRRQNIQPVFHDLLHVRIG